MQLKIDELKKLHQKKYRSEFGYFLVEGEHLILELEKAAEQNAALQNCELFVTENYQNFASRFKKNLISEKNMAQLSDTKTPQGIIAVAPLLSPTKTSSQNERAIYLHEVQDPGNLGTILRSLAWFGNFRCLLSPGSVDPFNPKVVRSSMGSIFHVPLELDVPLESIASRFKSIATLDMNGKTLSDSSFKQHDCYVFGNEARGVPRENLQTMNAQPFTISGCGAIESLNLAAAVNMCVYELMR
ncbi:TrmH family RNA methyltransferase [Cellvibrio sp. OA-2007]|uniref:TrmH family RNA methyltransferase n=1 Tax=Cellvibrio sp. OA-2007 TaxID=529823 RepID=UPI000781073B|nr:RNA methyltransferase [Cellvibrio sp. OA-2007]